MQDMSYSVCALDFSSVICRPVSLFNTSCRFQKYQKRFTQKVYFWENLALTIICFCCGHSSLKGEKNFH